MAHYAIGLDLGSSEVRAVVVRMSLGGAEIERMICEPVSLDENGFSTSAEVMDAAGRLIDRLGLEGESIYVCMPGESASIQRVTLPASVGRKLESVLKFELDEVLPFDIEEAVFGYVETRRTKEDVTLLSTTFSIEQVENLIAGLAERGIQPREIGVAPFEFLKGLAYAGGPEEGVTAFIDLGHERTNITILDKETPTLRTLIRGGRGLTARLAKAGGVDYDQAEAFKREYGFSGRVGQILKEGLRPLMREVRQTFKAHLASGGRPVTDIVLCGGGALLKGVEDYFTAETGLSVSLYKTRVKCAVHLAELAENPRFALGQAVAFREESASAARIDLRRGELAFKGDFEYLKSRLGWLGICVVAIVLSWLFATWAEYQSLSDRTETLQGVLAKKTKEIFKEEMLDHEAIKKMLSEDNVEAPPLPKRDAFDVLVELSKRIPASVVHDVDSLEIKSKRITIKGVVDAELRSEGDAGPPQSRSSDDMDVVPDLSPTDLIKQKLEAFNECFAAIRVGNVSSVDERRRYTMEIDTRCP